MTDLTGRKPILALDFDGVCHSYTSGWKGAAVIPDEPVPGLFEFLTEAVEVFEVNIWSSRSNQDGGLEAMFNWFVDWYVKQYNARLERNQEAIDRGSATPIVAAMLRFPTEKPPAFVGLDDRVLTFTGKWPSVESLKNFKPWNAKEV